jgi:hypothetical protein
MDKDLKSPRLIKFKAALFLVIAATASALLIMQTPRLGSVALLAIALWAACRCYYFAFYVLQHYVDPAFRYSGLWSMLRYLTRPKTNAGRNAVENKNRDS